MAFINGLSTSYLSILNSSSLSSGLTLDDFGQDALFGYSLRKLKDDADKCIRVVKGDGSGQEKDIGFTSEGNLDILDIDTFADGYPCYVKVWYNQFLPEATIHLASSVQSQQPIISDGIDHIWSSMTDTWFSSEDTVRLCAYRCI